MAAAVRGWDERGCGVEEGERVSEHWTEDDSAVFVDMADMFVPSRDEQIMTMCQLIPASPDEAFTVVELGAGDGMLASAVLIAFPLCRYVALDGSAVMRAQLRTRLAPFGERVEVGHFELMDEGWRGALPVSLRCVLSSLVVHHLTDEGKRRLFADLAARLEPGGGLVVADVIEPVTVQARRWFAVQWDEAVRAQSLAKYGDLRGFVLFQEHRWNSYMYSESDPMDHLARLFDQLLWLREAGFQYVDCLWMRAGHAIFAGYLRGR